MKLPLKRILIRTGIVVAGILTITTVVLLVAVYWAFLPHHTIADVTWLPKSAKVLFFADDHGGFHGDGRTYLVFTTTEEDNARLVDYFKKTHQLSWRTGPIDGTALQTLQGAIELIIASKQFENEAILPDYLFPSAEDVSFLVGYGGAYDGVYYELVVIDNLKSQIWYWELDT